ncbi:hypothetical protein Purlil1_4388 [Purpureocillium lilacinum]|uniref:Uncharacterized protein n=1 Tax=Purpureocillium lilacinum TaxID=33203 RepID=A0ABR0C5E9_PURLI|nr:hypothetical protein Purlil1_4388 [Purpureocillium lilacinum]
MQGWLRAHRGVIRQLGRWGRRFQRGRQGAQIVVVAGEGIASDDTRIVIERRQSSVASVKPQHPICTEFCPLATPVRLATSEQCEPRSVRAAPWLAGGNMHTFMVGAGAPPPVLFNLFPLSTSSPVFVCVHWVAAGAGRFRPPSLKEGKDQGKALPTLLAVVSHASHPRSPAAVLGPGCPPYLWEGVFPVAAPVYPSRPCRTNKLRGEIRAAARAGHFPSSLVGLASRASPRTVAPEMLPIYLANGAPPTQLQFSDSWAAERASIGRARRRRHPPVTETARLHSPLLHHLVPPHGTARLGRRVLGIVDGYIIRRGLAVAAANIDAAPSAESCCRACQRRRRRGGQPQLSVPGLAYMNTTESVKPPTCFAATADVGALTL